MSHTARRIYYSDDTSGGESGSPVYTWYKGYWMVIGIHHGNPTSGECRNDGPRFILEMISRFVKRMNSKKALLSMQFSAVYVRASGSDLSSSKSIGGIVDCKYNILTDYERFYIYPLDMPPPWPSNQIASELLSRVPNQTTYSFVSMPAKHTTSTKALAKALWTATMGLKNMRHTGARKKTEMMFSHS